ncbi:MAG TPA: hypothetical protein DHV85_09020 [Candidatus Accumulibacter sp.]|nr:hypothetical protein [Accumulibacter sp.]
MSRFPLERLLLGCSAAHAVLLVEPASAMPVLAGQVLVAEERLPASASAALAAALPGLTGRQPETPGPAARNRSLIVTVDDGLARSFVVTPPRGTRGLRELRATAAARFATLYGASADDWLLVGDWHARVPFIVSGLPRVLYQALQQLALSHGWRLDSVSPAFVRVWNGLGASIPANGWLLVGFGSTLTLLATGDDRIAGLRSLRLPAAPDLAALETLLEQEILRAPAQLERGRQALLWAGAAEWLPVATSLAGMASRTIACRALASNAGEASTAGQLALAGRSR